ncbi:hypothetical protein CDAR_546571 [Caerostris darwini]|uniref:Uncharacterized protein n=1 Tax=Caerostris darwini TaxID=1538125 RepID=A0AAV4N0L8_9ARAC|nr:hypothetical protein CDAR_546571 [Caerostris darwini]
MAVGGFYIESRRVLSTYKEASHQKNKKISPMNPIPSENAFEEQEEKRMNIEEDLKSLPARLPHVMVRQGEDTIKITKAFVNEFKEDIESKLSGNQFKCYAPLENHCQS